MLVDQSGSKWLGCHAVYTLIQCTPLLVEKAGVAPDMTFGITVCKQERVQARDPLWIWIPWGRTHKVQNRSNQWLHKLGLVPTKIKKKKKSLRKGYVFSGVLPVRKTGVGSSPIASWDSTPPSPDLFGPFPHPFPLTSPFHFRKGQAPSIQSVPFQLWMASTRRQAFDEFLFLPQVVAHVMNEVLLTAV